MKFNKYRKDMLIEKVEKGLCIINMMICLVLIHKDNKWQVLFNLLGGDRLLVVVHSDFLSGSPLAFGPDLDYIWAKQAYYNGWNYIFWFTIFITMDVCVLHFYDITVLVRCWYSVSIEGRLFSNFLMCVLLITQLLRSVEILGIRKLV